MRKLSLVTSSFFILLFLNSSAQIWSPPGATWYYSYSSNLKEGYVEIKYIGDTIILGKGAKILQKKRYTYNFPGVYDTTLIGYEYTLIENNIVYYFRFGQFYKLYDFNSFAGDKWVVAGYGLNGLCDTLQEIKVDSIGLTNINGFNLKYQRINTKLTVWSLGSKLIERIGCIDSYMFPELNQCIVDLNEGGPLRCYYGEF